LPIGIADAMPAAVRRESEDIGDTPNNVGNPTVGKETDAILMSDSS
jgi:hypothetical protein